MNQIRYPRITELTEEYIKTKINEYLLEDSPQGDFSTIGTVDKEAKSTAYIETQEDIIFVGEKIIPQFFDSEFEVKIYFKDGDFASNGSILAEIYGNTGEILTKERVILNLIQRLSGIATITNKYVKVAEPYGVKILDTRKTTPGLRLFEKYAVSMGGGHNHRADLSAAIMLKDNHIKAAGSISNAINNVKRLGLNLNIEVEAETLEQVSEIVTYEIDGILLDNMDAGKTIQAVQIVGNSKLYEKVYIISSGAITFDTIKDYLGTGIDGISVGAITHSVKSSEIHIEFR
jgi:nicotinate-nucleotide pyrophosphorylase (carboxylating)